jgi:hypothetical protein
MSKMNLSPFPSQARRLIELMMQPAPARAHRRRPGPTKDRGSPDVRP